MRSRYPAAIALMALLALPRILLAQSTPAATAEPPAISATIAYHENNSGTFDVRDEAGISRGEPADGDELKIGYTIVTGWGDVAELKLNHTSTIIRVAGNTNFRLDALRGAAGGQDVFSMAIGRVRFVAGRASTKDLFQVKAGSAVCGVRGSDVVIEMLDTTNAKLTTLEGTGWIQAADGRSLDVPQGYAADTAAPDFTARQVSPDVLQGLQDQMKFARLDVNETIAVNRASSASLPQGAPGSGPSGTPAPSATSAAPETPTATSAKTPPAAQTSSTALAWLRNILGMEIGSLTVADPNNPGSTLTYAMAVLEPTFTTGKLKMVLYLPVTFQGDLFNESGWYRPAGNNEWSFGTDQSGLSHQAADFARDLLWKIKDIEYGARKDPFFLKVGNLDGVTIGHGLVMSNFANDTDFPAVRHVGVDVGVDTPAGGFEGLVSDVAPDIVGGSLEPPDVIGGRISAPLVPGASAKIGFSAIVDLNPARDFVDPANGIVMPGPGAA
ncbi:MAG: FecR domain-containing protein, partial [Spirochaetia bacterium]